MRAEWGRPADDEVGHNHEHTDDDDDDDDDHDPYADDDIDLGAAGGVNSGLRGREVRSPKAQHQQPTNKQKKKPQSGRRSTAGAGGGTGGSGGNPPAGQFTVAAAAVPSNSLVVFARLAELCQIGLEIVRWRRQRPRLAGGAGEEDQQEEEEEEDGPAASSAAYRDEQDGRRQQEYRGSTSAAVMTTKTFWRDELHGRLRAWEAALEPDLRIGSVSLYSRGRTTRSDGGGDEVHAEATTAGAAAVSLVRDRPRWTVAMHLVLATLHLCLEPHELRLSFSLRSSPPPFFFVSAGCSAGRIADSLLVRRVTCSSDAAAATLRRIAQILDQLCTVFTSFRSLPMAELPLYFASSALLRGHEASAGLPTSTLMTEQERAAARSVARTASELGRVLPVARRISARLGLLITSPGRGAPAEAELVGSWEPGTQAAASAAVVPAPPPSSRMSAAGHAASALATAPAPAPEPEPVPPYPSAEPFQAFLSYAQDLGPAAEPSTILDFGSWDQSDLLVSLGLVGAPGSGPGAFPAVALGGGAGNVQDNWSAWDGPIEGAAVGMVGEADHDSFPLPVLMETGLGSIFNGHSQPDGTANLGGCMAIDSVGAGAGGLAPAAARPPPPAAASAADQVAAYPQSTPAHPTRDKHGVSLPSSVRGVPPGGDAMVISPDPQLYAFPRPADSTSQPATMAFDQQQQQQQPPQREDLGARTDHNHNAAYLPRSLFGTPVPPGSNMSMSSLEGQQAYEAAVGTDLLTRWLDRGTLGFTPETTPGLGGNGSRGDASGPMSGVGRG